MSVATPSPLAWPPGVPRTDRHDRRIARFSSGNRALSVADGLARIDAEIRRFTRPLHRWRIDPDDLIVSSNLALRLDGFPRSGQPEPRDPGVAVYFVLDGDQRCMPCDRWTRVADNMGGIAAALGALRGLERWVNESHVRAAFTGFAALEHAGAAHWREVLDVPADPYRSPERDLELAEQAFRQLAAMAHPDKPGGNADAFRRLTAARDAARAEYRGVG